jgi:hypothetical protein
MNKIQELKKVLPAIENSVPDLKKESVKSLCGPCPKCGGVDRFVFRTDSERFFCRQCNPKGGDILDFHVWLNGHSVKDLLNKYLPDSRSTKNTYQKSKPFIHYELGSPVEKYSYTDQHGKVLYYNCRFKLSDGGKTFRQCSADGLGWKVTDIKPKVPYNLQAVIEADEIFLVEGEKDVHSMAKLSLVASCSVAGAEHWTPDLNEHFRGKNVYLMPDNDEPGLKHIAKVYENLKDIAGSIRLIELPGLSEHGDFSDWLSTYTDIDEAAERFSIMVEGAEPYLPEKTETESKVEIVSIESIANAEIESRPIIDGLLDEKESLITSAASGTGKSLLMTYLALALGNPPQGGLWGLFYIPKPVKSLIVQSENSLNAFNKRLNKVFNACPEMKAGAKNVFILKTENDCRLAGSLKDKDFQKLLIDSLLSVEAGNLILDPLISYHGEDENDNAGMRRSLDCLSLICDQSNVSTMICHHYNRQNLTRGAASIRDWACNMLLMDFEKRTGDSIILKITHDKARNYEQRPDFYLERTPDLQFLRCEKPGKQSKQIEAVITALTVMGGYVESQAPLKNAVMVELNCSEATARRAICEALEMKKVTIIPGTGKGNPSAYKLSE